MTVKVGDKLAFRGFANHYSICTVERITASGRIICGKYTLNPDLTVRGRNDSFHTPYEAEPVTPEIIASVIRRKTLEQIVHTDWPSLTFDALKRIETIIKGDLKR